MIDLKWIEEFSRKNQTTKNNVAREYCQHLFLSKFYRQGGAEKILFKGGTALRILWRSPRFSEDLDFQGLATTITEIENTLESTCLEVEREGLKIDIQESKKTTGGYFGKILFQWQEFFIPIQLEISSRKKKATMGQTLIDNDYIPSYTLLHVSRDELIEGKVQALLNRAKPRDFFDLYFILRSHLGLQATLKTHKNLKQAVLTKLNKTGLDVSKELKEFLPASYHPLLKNFKANLQQELERAFP